MNFIVITSFLFLILILILIVNFKFNNNDKYDDNTSKIKKSVVFADELNKPLKTIIKIT